MYTVMVNYEFYYIQISMNVHHQFHVNKSAVILLAVFSAPVMLDMHWIAMEGTVQVRSLLSKLHHITKTYLYCTTYIGELAKLRN